LGGLFRAVGVGPVFSHAQIMLVHFVILEREGLTALDALRVASAGAANADFLLTRDDRLVRRYAGPLQVLNPVQFILRMTDQR